MNATVAAAGIARSGALELIWGLSTGAVVLGLFFAIIWLLLAALRRRARRLGYAGLLTYLRAMPRNAAEKRDAVDLFARGVALTFLGIIFHPFVIFGLVPLYYGCRKLGGVIAGIEGSGADDSHADQSGSTP